MANSVSLQLDCPKCARSATVFVSEWPPNTPRTPQTWTCPHCRETIQAELPGKVLWILARQSKD